MKRQILKGKHFYLCGLLIAALSLSGCGTKDTDRDVSIQFPMDQMENTELEYPTPPVAYRTEEPPVSMPGFDENTVASSEREDEMFGLYAVTDLDADGKTLRVRYFREEDESMYLQAYYTYAPDSGKLDKMAQYGETGELTAFALYDYDVDGAAQRRIDYSAENPQTPIAITDTDAAGRVLYQWQVRAHGYIAQWAEVNQWACAYQADSPMVTVAFSTSVPKAPAPQKGSMVELVAGMEDAITVEYEMKSPEHQVLFGGYSMGTEVLTALSIIEGDQDGNYLLLSTYNRDSEVYYIYDCVEQNVLLSDESLAPQDVTRATAQGVAR